MEGAFLNDEPQTLLRIELREPSVYNSILEAISNGCKKESIPELIIIICYFINPFFTCFWLSTGNTLLNQSQGLQCKHVFAALAFLFMDSGCACEETSVYSI